MGDKTHKNVLVVDDEPAALDSTSLLLAKEGYTVTSCGDALEALGKIPDGNFDLVLSDIKMPRFSGMELLEKIHAVNPELPVILMTAYADLDIAVKAISKGAFDFLIKPSPPDYLLHSVKKAFQHTGYLKLKKNYKLYLEDMVRQRTRELENEISEHNRTEEALRLSEKQLRALAAQLQQVEATERKELARELHDRVGQSLTALSINLNIIQNRLSADMLEKFGDRLKDSMALVEEIAKGIRGVMDDLRPNVLDYYGLVPALKWLSDRFAGRTGVAVTIHDNAGSVRLPQDVESALFYISKEALNNIARHAEAQEVTLAMEIKDNLARLTITDNGRGFDMSSVRKSEKKPGWGLLIMQERAHSAGGRLRIESEPGKGTRITIDVER